MGWLPVSDNPERPMSAVRAMFLVRKLVAAEMTCSGDLQGAMERVSRKTGVGFWSISHLRKGNAKTVDSSLLERLSAAYLDLCVRQIEALQHEIAIEGAVRGNDDLGDLEAEAAALAAKISARKAALR
jgi:hypothetical protein